MFYLVLSQRSPVPTHIPVFYGILVPRLVPGAKELPFSTVQYGAEQCCLLYSKTSILVLASTRACVLSLLSPSSSYHYYPSATAPLRTTSSAQTYRHSNIRQPRALALLWAELFGSP